MDDVTIAAVAKALAHPARVRIVRLLASQAECRGAEVFSELPLAQSTISEHLRILKDAGIVDATRLGNSTVYCIVPSVLASLADSLGAVVSSCPSCAQKEC